MSAFDHERLRVNAASVESAALGDQVADPLRRATAAVHLNVAEGAGKLSGTGTGTGTV